MTLPSPVRIDMLERTLEDRVCRIVRDALPDGVAVEGFWTVAPEGALRAEASSPVAVRVRIHPRGFDAFTSPCLTVQGDIQICAALSGDPSAMAFSEACSAVLAALDRLHGDSETAPGLLSVPGFAADGISLSPGECDFDADDRIYTATFPVTVYGRRIRPPATGSEEG